MIMGLAIEEQIRRVDHQNHLDRDRGDLCIPDFFCQRGEGCGVSRRPKLGGEIALVLLEKHAVAQKQ